MHHRRACSRRTSARRHQHCRGRHERTDNNGRDDDTGSSIDFRQSDHEVLRETQGEQEFGPEDTHQAAAHLRIPMPRRRRSEVRRVRGTQSLGRWPGRIRQLPGVRRDLGYRKTTVRPPVSRECVTVLLMRRSRCRTLALNDALVSINVLNASFRTSCGHATSIERCYALTAPAGSRAAGEDSAGARGRQ